MQAIDFKRFVFENNIKQAELVEYLNVSKGYISLVVSGKKKLSEENLGKLINNPFGWDVSILSQSNTVTRGEMPVAEDALVVELRSQIEALQAKVDNLNRELGEKNALLKMMRQGGKGSAQNAGVSSSADAV